MAKFKSRYSTVAIFLHWTIAALILLNIWFGWRMSGLKGMAQFDLFQIHKSIGITILLLSIVRLGWRLINRPPPYPASMTRIERLGASAMHWLLYNFMIVLPLTGWIIVSASPYNLPTVLFRTVPWPHLGFIHDLPMAVRQTIEARFGTVHEWLAWSLLALAVFHAAAALKHHFYNRDDVLSRMLPFLNRKIAASLTEI
jgi:cytochrome b561